MKWDLLEMKLLWAKLWKKDQFRIVTHSISCKVATMVTKQRPKL